MCKADMTTTIKHAMDRESAYIAIAENDKNPQVVEMVNLAKGRVDGYEAVLYLLRTGSTMYF